MLKGLKKYYWNQTNEPKFILTMLKLFIDYRLDYR